MSEKRRDKKGRLLRNGECQRDNGLYQFDYVDVFGKAKCVYSWKLEETDPLPKGKRKCISLREKEKEILKDIDDGIVPYGGNLTVLELTRKYVLQRKGIRENTRIGYYTVLRRLEKEKFGTHRIDEVKISDAKLWLIKLQEEDGLSYSTIHHIKSVLTLAFKMALDDDLVRKNPFDFQVFTILVKDGVRRDAITHAQKRKFLEFIKNDKHFCKYYDAIYILFHTGLRISEFTGLTIKDIDLEKKQVNIERQLLRPSNMRYTIEEPKTKAGKRIIPITDEVCSCFERILKNRVSPKTEPVVDGYSGFLYLDKNNMPTVAMHWEKYFQHIREKYNSIYKEELPLITPHVCRHTYCSHMASTGINPKHLQYLMGHSDISVTLNTYTHVELANVEKELEQLQCVVL